jgi:DNA polymerase-3 subunit chi
VTAVEFHTGITDPLGLACRLLRRAYRQGVRVQVTAAADVLTAMDHALWTQGAHEFIPHVRLPAPSAGMAARTPLWLCTRAQAESAPRVLVNLGADVPTCLEVLDRIIEIVGNETDDVARGRARWRTYLASGLTPQHQDSEHGSH